MEVDRAEARPRPTDFRIRQLRARDMLRGDLEGDDLDEVRRGARAHDDARQGRRLGARQLAVPATFGLACCAIEMMSIVGARARHRALRLRGVPRLAAPGRPADPLRPRLDQDGAGRAAHLRPDARAQVGDRDGRLLARRWASSTTTRSCRRDKFMPVDVHVPGLPAAAGGADARDHQAARDGPGRPDAWAGASATAAAAPRRSSPARRPARAERPGTRQVPDATGLELLAQELRERDAESVVDTVFFRGKGDARGRAAARSSRRSRRCASEGYRFLASVHGVDYYPRSRASASTTSCSTWTRSTASTVKLRVPDRRAARAVA